MDEKHERAQRRRAIRLWLRGLSPRQIARWLDKSERWIYKWVQRYRRLGRDWARSQSRRPQTPQGYGQRIREAVIRLRQRLVKRKVGLIGPREIREELRRQKGLVPVPSLSTIQRMLRASHLITPAVTVRRAYFPQPRARQDYVVHLMDWTSRYLRGGTKVYAFHTLDLETRGLQQTISTDKSGQTVRRHVVQSWQTIGLPHGLQMDNDAAFCGGSKVKRVFGALVRLCLFVGIEPIFIPVREPKRQGVIEPVNGMWSQTFWQRFEFRTVAHVKSATPQFEKWYQHRYHPPSLNGQTVAQVCQQVPRTRLRRHQAEALPTDSELPISAGRLHFIRPVDEQGDIELLNETWHVNKRLAGEYVWATIVTHEQRLSIYHRRSTDAPVCFVKSHRYLIPEPVVPLSRGFRRAQRRRKICTML
jgi:transposase